MKVLIINGGPRVSGATATILKTLQTVLEANHQVEWFDVYSMNIQPCIGCLKCRPNRVCILKKDDAHRMAEKIASADLFIVGTPTYWGNMTGQLKLLFDRCVPTFEFIEGFRVTKRLKGKRAVLVTTSAAPFPLNRLLSQSGGALRSLKTIMRGGGVKIEKVFNIARSGSFETRKEALLERVALYARRNLVPRSH